MNLNIMENCCGMIIMENFMLGRGYHETQKDAVKRWNDDLWEKLTRLWLQGFIPTILCVVPEYDDWDETRKVLKDAGFLKIGPKRPRSDQADEPGIRGNKLLVMQLKLEKYKRDGSWKELVKKYHPESFKHSDISWEGDEEDYDEDYDQ